MRVFNKSFGLARLLSETEERDRVQAILAEGMRRYGEPEISERGVVSAGVQAGPFWLEVQMSEVCIA